MRLSLSHSLGNVKPPHPFPAEAGQVPAHTVQAGCFSDSHLLLIRRSEGNLLGDFAHLITFHLGFQDMEIKVLILIATRLLLLPATFCQSGKSSSGIGWGGNVDCLCCGSQINLLFLLPPRNCEPKGRA